MAIQSPPGSVVPMAAGPPTAPRKSGCFGRGCGCGCGGCLLALVLVALLVFGGGYFFLVAQASAAVTAPASLIVFNQPVTVNGNPGVAGAALNNGDTVATGVAGHASIELPDGSFVRLAPSTTVTVKAVQLQRNGQLQTASFQEKVGRTFTNVEHLASGASFEVNGHSVSAQVRGTQFEVLVRPDGTNRIWAFVGTVTIAGSTTQKLNAGQEIDADANGRLSNLRSSQFDVTDAFPLTAQCKQDVASGTTAGTSQSTTGDTLTAGQTAESDYSSPGGNLTMAFCYPGSLMSVTVTDPAGRVYARQGAPPLMVKIANGPAGVYKAVVRAITVVAGGEPYAISFATDAACVAGNVDTGTGVRETLSNSQIASSLAQSGVSGVTLQVQGTSATSARVYYSYNQYGLDISWTAVFYAATPNLGAVITQVTFRGVNVTTQVVSRLSAAGASITSIPSGFVVDRVYSCTGAGGDGMMVIEGHR